MLDRERELALMVGQWITKETTEPEEMLDKLLSDDFKKDDMFCKAMIRLLFYKKEWNLNNNRQHPEKWKDALEKYFGNKPDCKSNFSRYIDSTTECIQETFNFKIPTPVAEPAKKAAPTKKTAAKKTTKKKEEG